MGLPGGVLEHLELSLDEGLGSHLFRTGRVLRRESEEVERDPLMQREFDLLGAHVAIPILDRESLVGVALFDERVTGEPMGNTELALIFHLLEQLGLAIKNIWWHDQVSARHEMMFDILRHIKTGCVVVGRELNVLHANDMARSCFPRPNRAPDAFDFNDLPQAVGSKVFDVLKTGKPVSDYKFHAPGEPDRSYQISVTPFRQESSPLPPPRWWWWKIAPRPTACSIWRSRPPICAWSSKWPNAWPTRSATPSCPSPPTSNCCRERGADPEFQESLAAAMEDGVKRVSRLVDQMRFLARDHVSKVESVPVKQLIEEAFREARAYHPSATVLLQYESSGEPLTISCDRQGLQHAFAEIILNALQANTSSCQVQVRTRSETDSSGSRWARIEVQDSGAGFSAEAAGKASEPFFTTRKVGLGLGLAVTSKIIQTHAGKLEIPPPRAGSPAWSASRCPWNHRPAPRRQTRRELIILG